MKHVSLQREEIDELPSWGGDVFYGNSSQQMAVQN